jgi:hypothetical protein
LLDIHEALDYAKAARHRAAWQCRDRARQKGGPPRETPSRQRPLAALRWAPRQRQRRRRPRRPSSRAEGIPIRCPVLPPLRWCSGWPARVGRSSPSVRTPRTARRRRSRASWPGPASTRGTCCELRRRARAPPPLPRRRPT